jgi:hypothetical protein
MHEQRCAEAEPFCGQLDTEQQTVDYQEVGRLLGNRFFEVLEMFRVGEDLAEESRDALLVRHPLPICVAAASQDIEGEPTPGEPLPLDLIAQEANLVAADPKLLRDLQRRRLVAGAIPGNESEPCQCHAPRVQVQEHGGCRIAAP